MTKLEEIVAALEPYLHDHITVEARIEAARAVIQRLKAPDKAMIKATGDVIRLARWTPHMLWDAILDAILQEKPDDG